MATGETALNAGGEHSEDANRVLIHDFRNLLAVIVNYSELIAEETGDPEAVRADINEIRVAAERAIALTDKLRRLPIATSQTESPASEP
ncbi:MAG TPA: histidine kinase dimerization/phospho-acceptor domain-containing protein [Candidatus Dormibacteraeota bacterium]|nr:histidine kinase dimerization/phospho-acceptor domain-containing protein [Candidatus Dormibacteraeota bacterium]